MSTVVKMTAGNPIRGIIPSDFEGAFRIANAAVQAGYKPLSTPYGKPEPTEEQQKAAATMIIMAGLELGLPPTQALEVIAMINGRRCIWGDGIPALLWSNGFDLEETTEGEGDSYMAVCTVTRPNGKKVTRKFSLADAKQARLWDDRATVPKYQGGTKPNDSPWFKYGKSRMIPMRARGWAARDGAADILRGLRVAEEEQDQMRDITPAEDAPALTGPRRTAHSVRKSGDYERFETAVRACKTTDELSAVLDEWKALLQTMPESWEANANAFVVQFRQMMTATTVEPEPEASDELELNPDAFLEKLRFDIANCDDVTELALIAESNAEDIAKLPAEHKIEAARLLKEAAE